VGVAEIVAVDLIRKRAESAHAHLLQVAGIRHPPMLLESLAAPASKGRRRRLEQRHGRERAEREEAQTGVESCVRGDVKWSVAQEGIRVGLEADGEVGVVDHLAGTTVPPRADENREPWPASVVVTEPGDDGGIHEQRLTGVPL